MAGDQQAWQQLVVSASTAASTPSATASPAPPRRRGPDPGRLPQALPQSGQLRHPEGQLPDLDHHAGPQPAGRPLPPHPLDRATDSLDASLSTDDDGPTMADRWPTPAQSGAARRRPGAEGAHPAGAQTALAGAARGGHPARPRRYGLQRDCAGPAHPRRHREKPHQPRARGTCKAFATYRRAGGLSGRQQTIRQPEDLAVRGQARQPARRRGTAPSARRCWPTRSTAPSPPPTRPPSTATWPLRPCSQMLADARRGAAWLEMLRTPAPEPPAALLERILCPDQRGQGSQRLAGNPALTPPFPRPPLRPHAPRWCMPGLMPPTLRRSATCFRSVPRRHARVRAGSFGQIAAAAPGHDCRDGVLLHRADHEPHRRAPADLRASDLKPSSLKRELLRRQRARGPLLRRPARGLRAGVARARSAERLRTTRQPRPGRALSEFAGHPSQPTSPVSPRPRPRNPAKAQPGYANGGTAPSSRTNPRHRKQSRGQAVPRRHRKRKRNPRQPQARFRPSAPQA
jgi:hypothetical protein